MATNETNATLAQDLGEAIDELQAALTRASDAATRIKSLVPRVGAVNALLEEIDALLHGGQQPQGGDAKRFRAITRPTLVVPNSGAAIAQAETPEMPTPIRVEPTVEPAAESVAEASIEAALPQADAASELICFRLEFQSAGGPLDLRAVDDAVGEHPAVRDVALLDYDGRNATLKVWIVGTASPADVQRSLSERAAEIFTDNSDVTIIALEDAA